MGSSSGRRPWTALWHSHPDRWVICSRESIAKSATKLAPRKPLGSGAFYGLRVEFCSRMLMVDYVLTRWSSFTCLLNDGRICLSNNAA